ncbi:glycoside hydrolase superfamily, partial [Mortierella sp. GBAus27b]
MFAKVSILALLCGAATALIHGVDNSAAVPQATYSKALGQGFTRLVIRGYQEACSSGGRVDPNFVANYNRARAAGYTKIDTYWFPCTGSGNPCKSYATQLAELGATFNANKMQIGRIWLDLENDPNCGTWNYGTAGNLAQAKAIVAALKASGYVYGIYSSPGEWGNIFGSRSVVVDNSVPLWYATFDNDDSSLNMKLPFGGWTSAFGKQYTDQSASGMFDLNIFSS